MLSRKKLLINGSTPVLKLMQMDLEAMDLIALVQAVVNVFIVQNLDLRLATKLTV